MPFFLVIVIVIVNYPTLALRQLTTALALALLVKALALTLAIGGLTLHVRASRSCSKRSWMNCRYWVLYSIQDFVTNNQYPHVTNHEQCDSTVCLLTYWTMLYAEIIGLVQLWPWPWPGLGEQLTGLGLGLSLGLEWWGLGLGLGLGTCGC